MEGNVSDPAPTAAKPRWGVKNTLVCVVLFLLSVGIVYVVTMPLITTGHRDPWKAEAEQLLGSLAGQARMANAKSDGRVPTQLSVDTAAAGASDPLGVGCGVNPAELRGGFYEILDRVYALPDGRAMLIAQPKNSEKPWCAHVFEWRGASGEFIWDEFDSEDEALKYFGIR